MSSQMQDEDVARPQRRSEPVWTYRGYELRSGEFTTSMVHFFRAEIARANVWRQRLDTTTNWAVITTAATLSLVFGSSAPNHSIIILNSLLVTLFLVIEARRYRYYELWSYRIRLMETDFFAAMLVPPFAPSPDWSETLAESLLHPRFSVSMWEAFGRRFRRNYLWLYLVMALVWVVAIGLHPTAVTSWDEFFRRAAIAGVPGQYVLLGGGIFYAAILLVGLLTQGLHQATGEVLPRYASDTGMMGDVLVSAGRQAESGRSGRRAWFRPSHRREQLLSLIITDRPDIVARRMLTEIHRGVTRLEGIGMYSGQSHAVLICALTVTEVAHLKAVVKAEDANAFVIVTPAREILGRGFAALEGQEGPSSGTTAPRPG